jgi:hypothetical protein
MISLFNVGRYVYWLIQNAPIECGNFQILFLVNQVNCEKHKNYRVLGLKCHLIYAFYFLKIAFCRCYSWHAAHFCRCDQKLALTLCNRHLSVAVISFIICSFNSLSVRGLFSYTLAFKCFHSKESGIKRSGDLAGQVMLPKMWNDAFGKNCS